MIILTIECEACGYVYKDKGTNTKHKCPMCKHIEITEKYRDESEEQATRAEELEWIKKNRNIMEKMEDEQKRLTVTCPCGFIYFTMDQDQSRCPGCGEWEVHNGIKLDRKHNGSIHCQTCQQIFGPLFCLTCEDSVPSTTAVTMEQAKDVVHKRVHTYDTPTDFHGEDVFFETLIGSFREIPLGETA